MERNRNAENKLLDAMGQINDKWVIQALDCDDSSKNKPFQYRKYISIAASLLICMFCTGVFIKNTKINQVEELRVSVPSADIQDDNMHDMSDLHNMEEYSTGKDTSVDMDDSSDNVYPPFIDSESESNNGSFTVSESPVVTNKPSEVYSTPISIQPSTNKYDVIIEIPLTTREPYIGVNPNYPTATPNEVVSVRPTGIPTETKPTNKPINTPDITSAPNNSSEPSKPTESPSGAQSEDIIKQTELPLNTGIMDTPIPSATPTPIPTLLPTDLFTPEPTYDVNHDGFLSS